MSKSQEVIKQEKFIKKLEALAKCREGTARRERAAAKRARGEALLPSDTAPYIIKYNELEPSPTTRDLEEGLDTMINPEAETPPKSKRVDKDTFESPSSSSSPKKTAGDSDLQQEKQNTNKMLVYKDASKASPSKRKAEDDDLQPKTKRRLVGEDRYQDERRGIARKVTKNTRSLLQNKPASTKNLNGGSKALRSPQRAGKKASPKKRNSTGPAKDNGNTPGNNKENEKLGSLPKPSRGIRAPRNGVSVAKGPAVNDEERKPTAQRERKAQEEDQDERPHKAPKPTVEKPTTPKSRKAEDGSEKGARKATESVTETPATQKKRKADDEDLDGYTHKATKPTAESPKRAHKKGSFWDCMRKPGDKYRPVGKKSQIVKQPLYGPKAPREKARSQMPTNEEPDAECQPVEEVQHDDDSLDDLFNEPDAKGTDPTLSSSE